LLYKLFSLFVVVAKLEHNVGNHNSDRTRYALNTVH
jgi:hypothetical protein